MSSIATFARFNNLLDNLANHSDLIFKVLNNCSTEDIKNVMVTNRNLNNIIKSTIGFTPVDTILPSVVKTVDETGLVTFTQNGLVVTHWPARILPNGAKVWYNSNGEAIRYREAEGCVVMLPGINEYNEARLNVNDVEMKSPPGSPSRWDSILAELRGEASEAVQLSDEEESLTEGPMKMYGGKIEVILRDSFNEFCEEVYGDGMYQIHVELPSGLKTCNFRVVGDHFIENFNGDERTIFQRASIKTVVAAMLGYNQWIARRVMKTNLVKYAEWVFPTVVYKYEIGVVPSNKRKIDSVEEGDKPLEAKKRRISA
jgi:hypothetical protein